MGYRATIQTINSLGHLIEGNVITFLEYSMQSSETKDASFSALDKLISRYRRDFLFGEYGDYRDYDEKVDEVFRNLRNDWYDVQDLWRNIRPVRDNDDPNWFRHAVDRKVLVFLEQVSRIFTRCPVKAILLPGLTESPIDLLMTSRDLLKSIVEIHPGDTALIIQMEEVLGPKEANVLNVFPKFEKALHQIERWPGVFLWNKDDSIFLPVETTKDVVEIFEVLKYQRDFISYFKRSETRSGQDKKYAYLFHLSDLHFGNKTANIRSSRIVSILRDQLDKLGDLSYAVPIVTGDLMDTPDAENKQSYLQFAQLLQSCGFEKPIHILGNHDVDSGGFWKFFSNQKAIISSLSSSNRVHLIHELSLGIVKFDSNTGGELAQGKIGENQLMEIGTELDSIPNKDKYTFVAILHHHPLEISNPEWYARDWYEYILGDSFYERTMKLVDSDIFLQWIDARGIKLVLHGHKHIPKIQNFKDIAVIASGSSSGSIRHSQKGKTFLTYNLIKYDIEFRKAVSCSIVAEEILGAGAKNMVVQLL